MKNPFIKLVGLALSAIFTISLFTTVSASEVPEIYFSFTDYPLVAQTNRQLDATVTITWSDAEYTGIAQWYYNGEPLQGWRNENFTIHQSASSTLHYTIPRWENMPTDGWIGFELIVNGKSMYINQKIQVENFGYTYYHPADSARVLDMVKHVFVEATLNRGTDAYSSYNLSNSIGWLDKGTKVKYVDYYAITHEDFTHTHVAAKLLLDNGYTCWVPHDAINISKKNYTVYTDYTNIDKEIFVNAKDYASSTDWLVWISLDRQKINVFKGSRGNWKIEAIFSCATGKNITPTIDGVFKYSRYITKWDFKKYYVKYVMIFNGSHALHSRTYRTANDQLLDETIGSTTSLGCVRMYDEDILWLRDHLPLNSTVVVF
ncbi:MAG: L,D-transpeptidase [Bacillota bacterium]|nr:L,D-transpeptidase [Bacillota bacterium]